MENSVMSPQKIENRIAIWSINFNSVYISKKFKINENDICIPVFIAVLFTVTKSWKHLVMDWIVFPQNSYAAALTLMWLYWRQTFK